jgi:hypothetical protein
VASVGISAREFARRDGCTHTLVNRAIKTGHLSRLPDGSLDPVLVGTGWREENRRNGNGVSTAPTPSPPVPPLLQPGETPEEAAARFMQASGAALTMMEAERVKENYLALLRQLEYDTKSGLVVPVTEVAKAVGAQFAQVRTAVLAIPAERAPQLHRLKTVTELQDALRAMLAEALEGLTLDRSTLTTA